MEERKIEFRGLGKSGHWVYGNLVYMHGLGGTWTTGIQAHSVDKYRPYSSIAVDPKTIGQYTGLRDKDGADVFEGDVLEYPDLSKGVYLFKEQPKRRSIIKWSKRDAAFKLPGTGFQIDPEKIKIVGSIHRNPELLEDLK